jgi:hypothetical protein
LIAQSETILEMKDEYKDLHRKMERLDTDAADLESLFYK